MPTVPENIVSIGGGPAGLYFAILFKKAFPKSRIRVFERNRADDTFGFGVVFSDETLGNFQSQDPESFAEIEWAFVHWTDIVTHQHGEVVRSTGHGFSGLSRKRLLQILQARCQNLGIELQFQSEAPSLSLCADADLVLGADGVNSRVREELAETFRPSLDWRKSRFCWLGVKKKLRAFTFIFKNTEFGLFQVHAYPYEEGLSTFILECSEATWKRASLDTADESQTVAFATKVFEDDLAGAALVTNRSLWRRFPTVACERWHAGKVVLLGDAAHTAHFSIGSGTKLAMEDAIALVQAFQKMPNVPLPEVLGAYESARRLEVLKIQRAAQTSLEWFENSERYAAQPPLQFQFNLMTRSKRITFDNLRLRDAALVDAASRWFQGTTEPVAELGTPEVVPPAFTPFRVGNLRLKNRIVVSPMCQYSAVDGTPNEWHLVHLGSRALGGAGLVIAEMTDVSADGRITLGCAGLYNDAHTESWKRIVDFVHTHSTAKLGIQLAHAGRKGSCALPWEGDQPLTSGAWPTLSPSAIPFGAKWPTPKEMSDSDCARVTEAFARATERAAKAGFDLVELHLAHGYLLSSFLSPLSNRRNDRYGGSLDGRMRFPLEVLDAVRRVWPKDRPIACRISAHDWVREGGFTPDDAVHLARALAAHSCDLIDVSSGGTAEEGRPEYSRMYQVPFADQIRHEAKVAVMAVGGIANVDQVNTIILAGRADLCAIARAHLHDPYLSLHGALHYGFDDPSWPKQYLAGRRPPRA